MIAFLFLLAFADDAWSWPITTEYGVTASFGEYRGQRFHMGLDFSTADQEGQPVRPALAGRVVRVRASPRGYGRAIYVKHKNGKTTVYAHLAAFGKSLSGAIAAAGSDPLAWFGNLEIDHAIGAEEILAYSGESGAGSPHFHFEVRDAANQPLNPLYLNFPELPFVHNKARIKGLYLLPLDSESRVNTRPLPFYVGSGVKRVSASGRIGVQVFAYISGNRASRLGCRGIRLYQDDRLIGEWLPQRLGFVDNGNGDLVHDPAFSGFGPTRYAYCFDNRSSFLPKLAGFKQTEILVVSKPTSLRIEAQNLAGDWSTLTLDLDGSAPRHPDHGFAPTPTQATTLVTRLYGDRLFLTPEMDGTLQTPERLLGIAGGDRHVIQPAKGPMANLVWRTKSGSVMRSYGVLPKTTTFRYEAGDWRLAAKDAPALPPIAVLLEPPDRKIRKQVLEYVSPVLRFGRPGLPSPGFSLGYQTGNLAEPGQLGIYHWSYVKKSWSYLGQADDKALTLDYLTSLVVARDISPPAIGRPKSHPYFTGARMVIPVRDKGSGLDEKDMSLQGPAGPIPVEYDPGRAWIILPKGEKRGPWKLEIVDRAGLKTAVSALQQ